MYKINFYTPPGKTSPIEKFLESLNLRQESKVTKALTYLREFGLSRSIPNLRKLAGTPLWELRILGKDNIRVICTSLTNREIIILHIFVKKKKKNTYKRLKLSFEPL